MHPAPAQPTFGFSGPLYTQVAAYLRAKISTAEWTPASPLPNEATLAKDIGVSIGTVRKALEILEEERLIDRRQGRGTFIVDASEIADPKRFSTLRLNGKRLSAEILSCDPKAEQAPADALKTLGLKADDQIFSFDLNWRAAPAIRGRDRLVVAAAKFPGLGSITPPSALTLFGLYQARYQILVHRVVEQIQAEVADAETAERLECAFGQPILKITRLAKTRTGEVIEWAERTLALHGASYDVKLG